MCTALARDTAPTLIELQTVGFQIGDGRDGAMAFAAHDGQHIQAGCIFAMFQALVFTLVLQTTEHLAANATSSLKRDTSHVKETFETLSRLVWHGRKKWVNKTDNTENTYFRAIRDIDKNRTDKGNDRRMRPETAANS